MSLVILAGGSEHPLLLESSIIRGLGHLTFGLTAGIPDKHQSCGGIQMSPRLWLHVERDGTSEKQDRKINGGSLSRLSLLTAQVLCPFLNVSCTRDL